VQEVVLVALRMKAPPRLGELRGQPDGDALNLQPSGCHSFKLGLAGANPLLRLITLSDSLVTLPAGHTVLRAEPFRGLA
jgi:hypothetical protein